MQKEKKGKKQKVRFHFTRKQVCVVLALSSCGKDGDEPALAPGLGETRNLGWRRNTETGGHRALALWAQKAESFALCRTASRK